MHVTYRTLSCQTISRGKNCTATTQPTATYRNRLNLLEHRQLTTLISAIYLLVRLKFQYLERIACQNPFFSCFVRFSFCTISAPEYTAGPTVVLASA